MKRAAYYEATSQRPPSPLLKQAVSLIDTHGLALDLGAGALRDSRFLLSEGFEVIAVDKSPEAQKYVVDFDERFTFVLSSLEEYDFPKGVCDVVNAMYTLPFVPAQDFSRVFESIIQSLKPGGVFVGQFFGPKDSWAGDPKMTFHNETQVQELLKNLLIRHFQEQKKEGKTALGEEKFWHVFHVIAQKK